MWIINLLGCTVIMKPVVVVVEVLSWSGLFIFPVAHVAASASPDEGPAKAEPGLSYGALPGFSLPKTILFSVGPDEIIADAQEWQRHGISAFFLDFVARDWSSDIWATDGEPWTIGASDKTFQKVKQATTGARRLGSEVFLKVAFDHPFEWLNEIAWTRIENNFRQFAIFARDSGCDGIVLDIEYIGLLVGPFASDDRLSAHRAVLPPERTPDPRAEYDGMNGKIRWREHHQTGPNASVDLTRIFQPAERVCAYALCLVSSPIEQEAQVRFASNDAGKVWLGGQLVLDYPREGSVELDRDIVPVHLPKGTTPILLQITNNLHNWGFVFRLTDPQGRPLRSVKFSLPPE